MTDATVKLSIDAREARQGAREFEAATDSVTRSTKDADKQITQTERNTKKLGDAMNRLKSIALGVGVALAARKILDYADSYRELENRVKVATNGLGDVTATLDRLNRIANQTRTPIAANVQLFQRASIAAKELGASQEELFRLTEIVGKGLAVQGGAAGSASGAILQLSQSLGSGIVRAEEFNSILEGAFPIAQAAARGIDEAGGSVAKLRTLIINGDVTSQAFFRGLLEGGASLDTIFAQTSATIRQAMTVLDNAFTQVIGGAGGVNSAAEALANSILVLAENLDSIAKVGLAISLVLGTKLAVSLATTAMAFLTSKAAAASYAGGLAVATAAAAGHSRASLAMSKAAIAAQGSVAASTVVVGGAGNAAIVGAKKFALLGVAMKAVAPLLLAAALAQVIIGTNEVAEATGRYGTALGELKGLHAQAANASGDRAKQIVEDKNTIIQAHIEELESLNKLIEGYASISDGNMLERGLGALGMAGAELFGRMGVGDAPTDVLEKADKLRDTIEEMKNLLSSPVGSGSGGGGGGITDELEKFKKILDDIQNDKKVEALEMGMTDLEKEIFAVDRMVNKHVGSVDNLTESQRKQVDVIKEQITENSRAREELEKLEQQQENVAQIFQDTASAIRDGFAQTFEDLFSGQIDGFSDVADRVKDIFVSMLAQLATLAIAQPIIVPIIQSIGSSIGVDSAGIEQVVEQLGGGGGGGNGLSDLGLGDLSGLSDVFSIGSLGESIFALDSTVGNLIDTVGHNIFGVGTTGLPTLSGSGVAGGLSQSFTPGAGLAGFGGTMAADLLGLSGEYSSITGTVGTIIGTAVGGPLGAAIGGFLGSAVGGLFGGGAPNPAATAGVSGFTQSGGLTGVDLQAKHLSEDAAQAIAEALQGVTSSISRSAGLDLSLIKAPEGGTAFQAGINDGTGFFTFGDHKSDLGNERVSVTFDPQNNADLERALGDLSKLFVTRIDELGGAVDERLLKSLGNIETEGRNASEVLNDIELAANFDNIGDAILKAEEPVSAFIQQLEGIYAEFDALRESSERLGLPLGELEEKLTAIEAKLRSDFNVSLSQQLLSAQSGIFADLSNETARYQSQLENATAINGDLALVEAIHAANLEAINAQYNSLEGSIGSTGDSLSDIISNTESLVDSYKQITENLGNALFAIQVGDDSSLSPTEKLALAEQRFNSTAALARSGNVDAANDLPGIANEFLSIAREVYASEDNFDKIFASVTGELQAASEYYQSEIDILSNQLEVDKQQLAAIEGLTSTIEGSSLMKVNSLANPDILVSQNNVNERLIQILPTLSQDVAERAIGLLREATPGVEPGNGTRSIFFEQNQAANNALYNVFKGIIPGFAKGGRPFSTTPALVGELGAEVIAPNAGSSIIPIQNNQAMLNEMVRSNQHLSATVKLLQAGLRNVEDQQRETNEYLQRLNSKSNRARA